MFGSLRKTPFSGGFGVNFPFSRINQKPGKILILSCDNR